MSDTIQGMWDDIRGKEEGEAGAAAGARSQRYWDVVANVTQTQLDFWNQYVKPELIKAMPGIFAEMEEERIAAKAEREARQEWIEQLNQAEIDGRLDELYMEGLNNEEKEKWLALGDEERANRLDEMKYLGLQREEAAAWLRMGDEERQNRMDELAFLGLEREDRAAWITQVSPAERMARLDQLNFQRYQMEEQMDLGEVRRRWREKYLPELERQADMSLEELENQRTGVALADTEQALSTERQGLESGMQRYGLDPGSAAYQRNLQGQNIRAAALKTQASNVARREARTDLSTWKTRLANIGLGAPVPIPEAQPVSQTPVIAPPAEPTPTGAYGGEVTERGIGRYARGGTVGPGIPTSRRGYIEPSAHSRVGSRTSPPVKVFAHGGRVRYAAGADVRKDKDPLDLLEITSDLPKRPQEMALGGPVQPSGNLRGSGMMQQWALGLPERATNAAKLVAEGHADEARRQYEKERAALDNLFMVGAGIGAASAGAPRSPAPHNVSAQGFTGRGPGMGFAEGGEIEGPGTGISDSIPMNLEEGSYVINSGIARLKGTEFFEKLEEKYGAEGPALPSPSPVPSNPAQTRPPVRLASGGNVAVAQWAQGIPAMAQRNFKDVATAAGQEADRQNAAQQDKMNTLFKLAIVGGATAAFGPFGGAAAGTMVAGMAEGGEVEGEQVPARVSDGEILVSPSVVKAKGLDFFNKINFPEQKAQAAGGGGLPG